MLNQAVAGSDSVCGYFGMSRSSVGLHRAGEWSGRSFTRSWGRSQGAPSDSLFHSIVSRSSPRSWCLLYGGGKAGATDVCATVGIVTGSWEYMTVADV